MRFVRNARRKKKTEKSSLEVKVEGWLNELGIEYQAQYRISRCHCDIFLPATRTIVELNGCYWHSHKCLGAEALAQTRHRRSRARDANRYRFFLNHPNHYKLLIVWECDVDQNPNSVRESLQQAARTEEETSD